MRHTRLSDSRDALSLTSGDLAVTVISSEPSPRFDVTRRGQLVASVTLGLRVDGVDLGPGASLGEARSARVREDYRTYLGKAVGERRVDHEEVALRLRTGSVEWGVIVRLASDGIAFRYELPEGATILEDERTRVRMPVGGRAWLLDYQTWYETPRFGSDLAALAPGDYGFPVLVRTPTSDFLLLSESDIDGRSSGAHVVFDGSDFLVTTADDVTPVASGHRTPWRVLQVGDLAEIVGSTLVDDLAPAAARGATPPRPGRGAWSWWSSQYSGAYLDVQLRFTDFAAEQGWEHVLVDCGWDAAWVPELVAYASVRGVQVHLWSSWADLDGPVALEKLALWRSWGVAGIKVDFMESESRERYRWYDAIIAESARVGLMVNFHGSVIPRGWARTYPHVVSYEAVRGAEYYVFYGQPLTAAHNVILPFTRNVVGSMDYTPVAFSAPGRETSEAHELALSVVYESGITHFADEPDEYRSRPAAAALLAELPAVWDDVRLLEGDPDDRVVLARRSDDRWFVGGLSASASPCQLAFDAAALVGGPADAWLVADSEDGLVATSHTAVTDPVQVPVSARGGFAAIVVPTGRPLHRARPRAVLVPIPIDVPVVQLEDGSAFLPYPDAVVRNAPGWTAQRLHGGWTVAPVGEPVAGDVAVIALERPGHDGVPVVGHVRIAVPYSTGEYTVSTLPFLATRNAVGPVERDLANGGGDPRDGEPLSACGETFADGIGVCQESEVSVALGGSARRLTGSVAIDDETPRASAVAVILLDGSEVARFPLRGSTEPHPIDLALDGAAVLTLRTEPGTDPDEAHVDWLALRLHA